MDCYTMAYCPKCNEIRYYANYCRECGSMLYPSEYRKCTCGAELANCDKYCPKCGKKLKEEAEC